MSADAARRAIELFFEGFNDEDDSRIHEALNFPHVRIASGTVRVIEGPALSIATALQSACPIATWPRIDQERGPQHHFAIPFPLLTAAARREFETALVRLASLQAIEDAEGGDEQ